MVVIKELRSTPLIPFDNNFTFILMILIKITECFHLLIKPQLLTLSMAVSMHSYMYIMAVLRYNDDDFDNSYFSVMEYVSLKNTDLLLVFWKCENICWLNNTHVAT